MKKVLGFITILMCLLMPYAVSAQDYDTRLVAVCESESIEVGDQFLVTIKMDNTDLKFLTFRINGNFDSEFADVIAPVYTNEVLGVLTNQFDNENGTFTFEGYDQMIRGTEEPIICSLLFEAKKSGAFSLNLEDCMLGKHNENAFYTLKCENVTVEIKEDSDGKSTKIIEDEEPQTPYDEVIMGHWAEKGITVMYKLGALESIADESIEPERNITRGEFAVMLQRVCKIKSGAETQMFADVDENGFMYEPIRVMKSKNLAEGDGNDKFMPDGEITRQDMFSLIFRTMVSMNKVDAKIDAEEYIGDFVDKDNVAPYAREPFAGVMRAKLWESEEEKCNPTETVTLAEACHILNKLAEFNILVSRN